MTSSSMTRELKTLCYHAGPLGIKILPHWTRCWLLHVSVTRPPDRRVTSKSTSRK